MGEPWAQLSPADGALRVRLDEMHWRAVWRAAGLQGVASAVAPMTAADPVRSRTGLGQPEESELDAPVLEAVRVACGAAAAVRVEVATTLHGRGLLASLGIVGDVAASAVRVLGTTGTPGKLQAVPGVEVGAFAGSRLRHEVMRLLPSASDRTTAPGSDGVPEAGEAEGGEPASVTLPWEIALVLAQALKRDDEATLKETVEQCGWSEVPDLLLALATEPPEGQVDVVVSAAGMKRAEARRWTRCRRGWVEIALEEGRLSHRLVAPDAVADDVIFAVTGAFGAVAEATHG